MRRMVLGISSSERSRDPEIPGGAAVQGATLIVLAAFFACCVELGGMLLGADSAQVLMHKDGIQVGKDGCFTVDGLEQKPYRIEINATGYFATVIEEARPSFDGVERVILLVSNR